MKLNVEKLPPCDYCGRSVEKAVVHQKLSAFRFYHVACWEKVSGIGEEYKDSEKEISSIKKKLVADE